MKYFITASLLILILFQVSLISAQQKIDINTTWIEIISADESIGIIEISYQFINPNDGYYQIYKTSEHKIAIMEGKFFSNKQEGVWKYYKDNRIYEIIEFENGLRNGENFIYYPSGQIKSISHFRKGVLQGDMNE